MRSILILLSLFLSLHGIAQPNQYVAARAGLSIRERPDAKATVIGKIPYGSKISVTYDSIVVIITEGMTGAWAKVTYNGKTGYIVNSYLLPAPPPRPGTRTMKEYLLQLTTAFGAELMVKHGTFQTLEEEGYENRKQLYKNGAEWHGFRGYESGSDAYFLPDFSIQQGFLLLRLLPEYSHVFNEKSEFPTSNRTIRSGDIEYEITVQKETLGEQDFYHKITMGFANGAVYNFEMYLLENQLVIFTASGV